jgi:hypothetical protein
MALPKREKEVQMSRIRPMSERKIVGGQDAEEGK